MVYNKESPLPNDKGCPSLVKSSLECKVNNSEVTQNALPWPRCRGRLGGTGTRGQPPGWTPSPETFAPDCAPGYNKSYEVRLILK